MIRPEEVASMVSPDHLQLDDVLATAGIAIGAELRAVGSPLLGGDRAVVVRAVVDGGPATVVVKAFHRARARKALGGGSLRHSGW